MKVSSERLYLITRAIERKMSARGCHAELFEMRNESRIELGKEYKKVYGVNWSALGTVSTEETRKFTEALIELAAYAEELNSLEIAEVWEDDEKITTREEALAFVERVENELKPGNIKTFLEL